MSAQEAVLTDRGRLFYAPRCRKRLQGRERPKARRKPRRKTPPEPVRLSSGKCASCIAQLWLLECRPRLGEWKPPFPTPNLEPPFMEKAAFLCTDGEGTKETREAMRDFILFVVLPIVPFGL